MDELNILKKSWNKPSEEQRKLSVNDIYPMLQKKSSSIVKILFYVSIAELILWILINSIPYFYSDEYRAKLNMLYTNEYMLTGITILSYGIIILFIYLLFSSYKSISVTDNVKKLMENILKTRKIIKYYVLYNLIMAGVSMIIGFYYALHNDPTISTQFSNFNTKQLIVSYLVIVLSTAVLIFIIWLFYRLIYGLLLKRLNRNYNELKKLDI